jgi:enhancer of polycomb-like protein
MDEEDSTFLVSLNSTYKKTSTKQLGPCTEDQFEEVISFFEDTVALKQPYAILDNTPILPYSEMEAAFDETVDDSSRLFARDIYEHWKVRRVEKQNHPLMPSLKFERNADTDEGDPYVCFRRREVRQARKTRGRDAQITEKLKKLRGELELARQLMSLTKQR